MARDPKLLTDLLSVLEQRTRGHAIVYSDRLTPFIPRLRAVIQSSANRAELTAILITCDGQGKDAKQATLNALLSS